MIKAHLHEPRNATRPTRGGAIVFALDETGNLLERRLVSSSGSPNLDMAVMNAIAEAAPYPAPPGWQPKALRLTLRTVSRPRQRDGTQRQNDRTLWNSVTLSQS